MRKADLGLGPQHSPVLPPDPHPWLAPVRIGIPVVPVNPGRSRIIFLIAVSWKPGAKQLLPRDSAEPPAEQEHPGTKDDRDKPQRGLLGLLTPVPGTVIQAILLKDPVLLTPHARSADSVLDRVAWTPQWGSLDICHAADCIAVSVAIRTRKKKVAVLWRKTPHPIASVGMALASKALSAYCSIWHGVSLGHALKERPCHRRRLGGRRSPETAPVSTSRNPGARGR